MPDSLPFAFGTLDEAVRKLGRRTPVGSVLSSEQWSRVPLALRERAQFSAKVESTRFLAEVQQKLMMAIAERQEQTPGGPAWVDRSSFIGDMKKMARDLGIETTGPKYKGTVRDIHSAKRLGLIYDQMTRHARGYSRWKMDMDPDVLYEVPAYRFTRVLSRVEPRIDWRARWNAAGAAVGWEGAIPVKESKDGDGVTMGEKTQMVALKTSPIWYELSRFGTPWPPFDYGSGLGVRDVFREDAEALGLIGQDEEQEPLTEDFNRRLDASTRGLGPRLIDFLLDAFGSKVVLQAGKILWRWLT